MGEVGDEGEDLETDVLPLRVAVQPQHQVLGRGPRAGEETGERRERERYKPIWTPLPVAF